MQVTAHFEGRPLEGGAVKLGGQYDGTKLLAPNGLAPAVSAGVSEDTFGSEWIRTRTKQLIALFDDPLYSFFAGVEAITGDQMRTTSFVGMDAIDELYATPAVPARGRFYVPMPQTFRDEERSKAKNRVLEEEIIRPSKRVLIPSPTGPTGFPVVVRIDNSLEAAAAKGAAARDAAAGSSLKNAEAISNGEGGPFVNVSEMSPNEQFNPNDVDFVVGPPEDINRNPAIVPFTAKDPTNITPAANPGDVAGRVTHTALNLQGSDGKFFGNLEHGEASLLRRIFSGEPLSPTDLEAWRILYDKGRGITQPIPRVSDEQNQAIRTSQRSQIERFIDFAPFNLGWRLIPENLRVLFLTRRAALALEHAAWFAEFHQPHDPNLPALMQTPPSVYASNRQRVPVIDLITHKQVRVPFQTLVANIILYWKHTRLGNEKPLQQTLRAINQVMMTLRTMREETNGFVSLMGHYDVEAQRSRFDTANARIAERIETGSYRSDMDREFYSLARRPGAIVPRSSLQDNALFNAMRAARPTDTRYDIQQDAQARYALVASILSTRKP